jgi:hypothetical protein
MKTHMIYVLVNPITKEPFYVGETTRLSERLSKHFNCTDKTKAKNDYILDLKNKGYKPEVLIVESLIESKDEAERIEGLFIKKYTDLGFVLLNKNNGGNKPPSQKGAKQTEKTKKLRSVNSPLIKRVQQIDKLGNVVNEFYGVREACRVTKIDHRSIAQVALGSKIRKTAGGYKWKYI